jgi:hypothetical protein
MLCTEIHTGGAAGVKVVAFGLNRLAKSVFIAVRTLCKHSRQQALFLIFNLLIPPAPAPHRGRLVSICVQPSFDFAPGNVV